ncbi:hypothetical protein [Comamonas sp. HJ-2]
MDNYSDIVKAALGRYLKGFHEQLLADTKATAEYAARPFSKAVMLAPGRMIDSVDAMLATYRKNDNSGNAQTKSQLPIIIVAVGKDMQPSGPEYGRGIADAQFVQMPEDPKQRIFKMRCASMDFRAQLAMVAPEEPTARTIAMQLHLYTSSLANRNLHLDFTLAGVPQRWGAQLENPDLIAASTALEGEVKNATALVVDMTVRAWLPFLTVPTKPEDSDGKGNGVQQGNPLDPTYDPSGFPAVGGIEVRRLERPDAKLIDPSYTIETGWGRP